MGSIDPPISMQGGAGEQAGFKARCFRVVEGGSGQREEAVGAFRAFPFGWRKGQERRRCRTGAEKLRRQTRKQGLPQSPEPETDSPTRELWMMALLSRTRWTDGRMGTTRMGQRPAFTPQISVMQGSGLHFRLPPRSCGSRERAFQSPLQHALVPASQPSQLALGIGAEQWQAFGRNMQ